MSQPFERREINTGQGYISSGESSQPAHDASSGRSKLQTLREEPYREDDSARDSSNDSCDVRALCLDVGNKNFSMRKVSLSGLLAKLSCRGDAI